MGHYFPDTQYVFLGMEHFAELKIHHKLKAIWRLLRPLDAHRPIKYKFKS